MTVVESIEVETDGGTIRIALCDFGGGWYEVHMSTRVERDGQSVSRKLYLGTDLREASSAFGGSVARYGAVLVDENRYRV